MLLNVVRTICRAHDVAPVRRAIFTRILAFEKQAEEPFSIERSQTTQGSTVPNIIANLVVLMTRHPNPEEALTMQHVCTISATGDAARHTCVDRVTLPYLELQRERSSKRPSRVASLIRDTVQSPMHTAYP